MATQRAIWGSPISGCRVTQSSTYAWNASWDIIGEVPVKLRPGERILQLVFHDAEPPAEFGLGTYALSIEASPGSGT